MFISECVEIGVYLRNRMHNLAAAEARTSGEDEALRKKAKIIQTNYC